MKQEQPLDEKLNFETALISWNELQLSFAQGKLLIVDTSIDLIETASLIAENSAKEMQKLIKRNKVAFASVDWVKKYCNDKTELWAVVIAPYVVAQLKNLKD